MLPAAVHCLTWTQLHTHSCAVVGKLQLLALLLIRQPCENTRMSQPATGQLTVPDVPLAAQDPDYGKWGFAQTPSLRELQHLNQAQQEQGHHDARSPGQDPDGWLASLHSSRVFACPGCIDAMGKALGLTEVLTALSGTLATPAATPSQAAAAVEVVHNAIDISWSGEALRRGVAAAKSGKQACCAMV